MFVDSHCHLDFPELVQDLSGILARMQAAQVTQALCISVQLETVDQVLAVASSSDCLWATVGVHPDYQHVQEPTVEHLIKLSKHPKVIAIGETGLDYFRLQGDLTWQRDRFRTHIRAGVATQKPIIVHTRHAGEDTLSVLHEEQASQCQGVIHCFTESKDFARRALDLGMYISFSGIVTFKNAVDLREVVKFVPLDRILIETDSPYLAPVPHRGKTNEPSYVPLVAQTLAEQKGLPLQEIGRITRDNFYHLFRIVDES